MNMSVKKFSPSCENNKNPIFSILKPLLSERKHLLEIGSATGQHALYFTKNLPHLTWQTTDRKQWLPNLTKVIADQNSKQLPAPLALDVSNSVWPIDKCEAIFTANTLHIMSWENVKELFSGVKKILEPSGALFIYGPFNYEGDYTSSSNKEFDEFLKAKDPLSGIRHFEDLLSLATDASLMLINDHEMPSNNRLLHFKRL